MEQNIAQQILDLVNEERVKAGVKSLTLNSRLTTAAATYAVNMATEDFFSHFDPDQKTSPADRIHNVGYSWQRCGENIAAGNSDPKATMTQWMNSPGHKANILNPEFTELGVGYFYLEDDSGEVQYKHYWCQVFATPSPH